MTDYAALLKRLTPKGNPAVIAGVALYLQAYLGIYLINTKLRIAHFLAQAAHESASFKVLQEYASGAAYEGRADLGNTQAGDGKRYKGRGIFQLTGRANYRRITTLLRKFAKWTGVDLETNPEKAADPEISVATACIYWNDRKINACADRDDVVAVTKKINGGRNGLADRIAYLAKAKAILDDKTDEEVAAELEAERKKSEAARNKNGAGAGGSAAGGGAVTQAPADPSSFDWTSLIPYAFGAVALALVIYFAIKAYRNHQQAQAYAAVK